MVNGIMIKPLTVDQYQIYKKNGTKSISYSMVKWGQSSDALYDYLNGKKVHTEGFAFGNLLHGMAEEGIVNGLKNVLWTLGSGKYTTKKPVYDLHTISSVKLLINKAEKQNSLGVEGENEVKLCAIIKYKSYEFLVQGYLDYISVKKGLITEYKTSSSPMVHKVIEKYGYDMQQYMYMMLAGANYSKVFDYQFVFFNKTEFSVKKYKTKVTKQTGIKFEQILDNFIDSVNELDIMDEYSIKSEQ